MKTTEKAGRGSPRPHTLRMLRAYSEDSRSAVCAWLTGKGHRTAETTLRSWEMGVNPPPPGAVKLLAKYYGVSQRALCQPFKPAL